MFQRIYICFSILVTAIVSVLFIDTPEKFWIGIVALVGSYIACLLFFVISSYIILLPIKKKNEYNTFSPFYHNFMIRSAEFLYSFCRVKIKYVGMEKVPKNTKFMLVQNHRSNIDSLATLVAFKNYPVSVVAKPSIFKIPLVGKLMTKNSCISINREDNREGIKSIIRAVNLIKSNQYSVLIYPEGTRNKTGTNILPLKAGSFKIAQKTDVPVVITTIDGSEKIKKNFPWKRTKITIRVADVIYPKDFANTEEMSEKASAIMNESIGIKQIG